jgi:hypothetical protein
MLSTLDSLTVSEATDLVAVCERVELTSLVQRLCVSVNETMLRVGVNGAVVGVRAVIETSSAVPRK